MKSSKFAVSALIVSTFGAFLAAQQPQQRPAEQPAAPAQQRTTTGEPVTRPSTNLVVPSTNPTTPSMNK